MEKIINAQIISTRFGFKSGCLTFEVFFEHHKGCQGMGGYCIGYGGIYSNKEENITGTKKGAESMARIMWTVRVDTWENLTGTYCRVKFDESGKITSIGHIFEDRWFNLAEYMKLKD